MKIAVVGAGIAGLLPALKLIDSGHQVIVVEAEQVASGVSGKATSYLEPRLGESPTRKLEWDSVRLWPKLIRDIEQRLGTSLYFPDFGQIKVCLPDDQGQFSEDLLARTEAGWSVNRLGTKMARDREPALSADLTDAIHLPQVRWLDGPSFCHALAECMRLAGGEVRKHWPVRRLESRQGRWILNSDREEALEADRVLLATGLNPKAMEGLDDLLPECRPVRGVNLVFEMSAMERPLRHLIKHRHGTLCPRPGNRLLVGTTYENGVFSLDASEKIVETLLLRGERILPQLRQLPVIDVTVGIRAKSIDGAPKFGALAGFPGIYYSLGHGGSGYLRAPAIADLLVQMIGES